MRVAAELQGRLSKLAFWLQGGLAGRSVWHFHPLRLVRHFKKCGWLTRDEFAQCIPRRNCHLDGTQFVPQAVATWGVASQRSALWSLPISISTRKYGISNSQLRMRHFLAQLTEESGYYRLVVEGRGSEASYAPYYGRGLIQLTHRKNYEEYGAWRGFDQSGAAPPFQELGWSPDGMIARTNQDYNARNCADSAAFYWTCPAIVATGMNVLKTSDGGAGIEESILASRSTNGNVPQQNINGLGTRLQAFIYLEAIVTDAITAQVEAQLDFDWRRNSNKEPLFHSSGQPILKPNGEQKRGYILGHHTLMVPMERQRQ